MWRDDCEEPVRELAAEQVGVVLDLRTASEGVTEIPVETRARQMPYRGRTARVTAIRDMRDRKRAEAERRASEEQLRLALEGAHMGIWVLDVATGRWGAAVVHLVLAVGFVVTLYVVWVRLLARTLTSPLTSSHLQVPQLPVWHENGNDTPARSSDARIVSPASTGMRRPSCSRVICMRLPWRLRW